MSIVYILNNKKNTLADIEQRYNFTILIRVDETITPSSYNMKRKLKMLADGVTAFSVRPLYLSILFSALLAVFGLAMLVVTLIMFFRLDTLPGWASQMTVLSLCFAAVFFVLSIQGLYIGRIFHEVRNRPQTIIKRTISGGKEI